MNHNSLKANAIEFDLEGFPGWVKFEFCDVNKKNWTVIEKLPVVGLNYPEDEKNLPFQFLVPVKILKEYLDPKMKAICVVELLYGMESEEGETKFEIFRNQLID